MVDKEKTKNYNWEEMWGDFLIKMGTKYYT